MLTKFIFFYISVPVDRTYALEFVVAQFIAHQKAFSDTTPIVGGASRPALTMKHRITTPHRSAA